MNKQHLIRWLVSSAIITYVFSCAGPYDKDYPKDFTLQLLSKSDRVIKDEVVLISVDEIKTKHSDFNPLAFVVLEGNKELASQTNDQDMDGQQDQLAFICDFNPNETKVCNVRYAPKGENKRSYIKRTQAEISHKTGGKFVDRKYEGGTFTNVTSLVVPPEHTDHSFYIRYEGPGWESDKVGYRFYLDWRNATDIFGKKVPDLVLQNVGQDGFDSYHIMSDWGMDILKVGNSLGLGSVAMWDGQEARRVEDTEKIECNIVSDGFIQSQIRTKYTGWKIADERYDLISNLTINSGSRITRHDLSISGDPLNLCTGIVKHESANLLHSQDLANGWQYLATYGKQSLADDNLGMAILFHQSSLVELTEDEHNHVIVLKPDHNKVLYYFLAAWEKEPGGITNESEFVTYLQDTVDRLNTPVKMEIN